MDNNVQKFTKALRKLMLKHNVTGTLNMTYNNSEIAQFYTPAGLIVPVNLPKDKKG